MKIFIKIKFLIILIILIAPLFIFAALEDVQYPVAELGNCKSESDCKAYCDKSENGDACLNFAQENNIMSEQEVKIAKQFLKASNDGPGGCKNKNECEEYCNDISHIDECISFAEKNDLIPPGELEKTKKVQSAIKRGVKPPPCGNKKACDIYCDDSTHMEECITFGAEAGFIQGKELEDAQKMLQALKKGVKPPPCKGKEACDEYCSNPDNMEVCMNFAIAAGMMSEEEQANSQKMLQALKKGVKPPPCKGKDECDAYCSSEEHMEECINFSVAAGMMSEKDAKMARKTKGKGPGGCKGKEECEAFCNNPDNQETCFNFGKENGMIPEEDLKRMEEGKQQMKQSLEQAPSETLDCLKTELGADMVEKMRNGFMPPQNIGEKMRVCFEKMGPGGPGEGGTMPAGQPGPGEINPGGQMMPPQAGPGGCKTPEECKSYCETNQEQCKNFYPAGDESLRGLEPEVQQQGQMPLQGQMQPGQTCVGENCQSGPLPGQSIQPGQELLPGQNIQPPATGPGAGGSLEPGTQQAPLAPPSEQQSAPPPQEQQQPPPAENPPPASSIINTDSFIGSLLYAAFKALTSY